MNFEKRILALEKKIRATSYKCLIDPFELARSGELSAGDIRYLVNVFKERGYCGMAEELEAAFKGST